MQPQIIPIFDGYTPAADGTYKESLPVHALSHITFNIRVQNVTNEATLAQILPMISNIKISRRGESIVDGSLVDLMVASCALTGRFPYLTNRIVTDNAYRHFGITIPFGRKLMDPDEGIPAPKQDELQLSFTCDIAVTDADGLAISADAHVMMDASPTKYLKYTTHTKTPTATGPEKIAIPTGNLIHSILLFATTVPATTANTMTIENVTVKGDDVENYFIGNRWEILHSNWQNLLTWPGGTGAAAAAHALEHYSVMSFDPENAGNTLFDTKEFTKVDLVVEFGDTNEMRMIPIQLVTT